MVSYFESYDSLYSWLFRKLPLAKMNCWNCNQTIIKRFEPKDFSNRNPTVLCPYCRELNTVPISLVN
jgi:hypothetical protein